MVSVSANTKYSINISFTPDVQPTNRHNLKHKITRAFRLQFRLETLWLTLLDMLALGEIDLLTLLLGEDDTLLLGEMERLTLGLTDLDGDILADGLIDSEALDEGEIDLLGEIE